MVQYYIEITEEQTEANEFRPLQMVRKYVKNIAEGEAEYAKEILNFGTKKTTAQYVVMNHNKDATKNKPCVSKKIVNGKVQ